MRMISMKGEEDKDEKKKKIAEFPPPDKGY